MFKRMVRKCRHALSLNRHRQLSLAIHVPVVIKDLKQVKFKLAPELTNRLEEEEEEKEEEKEDIVDR